MAVARQSEHRSGDREGAASYLPLVGRSRRRRGWGWISEDAERPHPVSCTSLRFVHSPTFGASHGSRPSFGPPQGGRVRYAAFSPPPGWITPHPTSPRLAWLGSATGPSLWLRAFVASIDKPLSIDRPSADRFSPHKGRRSCCHGKALCAPPAFWAPHRKRERIKDVADPAAADLPCKAGEVALRDRRGQFHVVKNEQQLLWWTGRDWNDVEPHLEMKDGAQANGQCGNRRRRPRGDN